jgi:hypothetical protein
MLLRKDLSGPKADAKQRIDVDAETFRLNFITPGSGQSMTYEEKYQEAMAFLANPNIDEEHIPHIVLEIGITAPTKQGVAEVIVGMRNQWKLLSAKIDAARLAAKKAVDEAANPADIENARNVNWLAVVSS